MSTWKKIIVSGSDAVLNSVTASNGYFGTASYSLLSISSSYSTTASYVLNAVSSSFSTNSMTASYFSGTVTSASFASTASFLSGGVTSASFASTASFLSGTVTSASYAQTATTASYSYQEFVNVQTLSADKTLTITDKPIQMLRPNGANRTITLPTGAGTPDGLKFEIWNWSSFSDTYYLSVGTEKIGAESVGIFRYIASSNIYVKELQPINVSIGTNTYNNYSIGLGLGYYAYNNYNSGIGIGNNANTNYDVGVGVGNYAYYNYSYGIGIGNNASFNYDNGIGIGNAANTNNTAGIGIGYGAANNYTYGLGLGYGTDSNNNYGIGIGYQAVNNTNSGMSIGRDSTSNTKGVGTVAIGAYSKAQRQNEFVTTATDNATNKAQSIIQKFRNIALATAAGAFQEIFTDASSGRLTILASSIYQFRIQINAIAATSLICKTWEITGGIKRNGSNVTTMVGGAPTYYITSEDSGTSNWDVRVTADDTNEALKIEVKHDSANNVTFSATVWATETRL